MEEVKTLTFDTSVSSMEYMADGEIVVITYGKTVAFYNALRYAVSDGLKHGPVLLDHSGNVVKIREILFPKWP